MFTFHSGKASRKGFILVVLIGSTAVAAPEARADERSGRPFLTMRPEEKASPERARPREKAHPSRARQEQGRAAPIPAVRRVSVFKPLAHVPTKPARKAPASKTRRLTLPELMKMAQQRNVTVAAARASIRSYEAQVFAAKWAWLPKVSLSTQVAPTPKYRCMVPEEFLPESWTPEQRRTWMNTKDADGILNKNKYCVGTDKDINIDQYTIEGLYFRFEVSTAVPISAFWKLPHLIRAAKANKSMGQQKVAHVILRIQQGIRKAYHGIKLAREILFTIEEGRGHLNKAIKKLEKDLAADEEDANIIDRYRLRILKSEVDTWEVEAKSMERIALAGLRSLVGAKTKDGAALDIDDKPLDVESGSLKSSDHYKGEALRSNPQIKLMDAAVKASRAAVKLSWAGFWPDLALALRYRYTYSNSDDPASAYASDGLHGNSFFIGLVLSFNLDFHLKYMKHEKAKAASLQALRGRAAAKEKISFEVEKAMTHVETAKKKIKLAREGHRAAESWLTAVSQRHDMGVSGAKEVSDALKVFFQTKTHLLRAIYEHNMAVSKLQAAVGRTD